MTTLFHQLFSEDAIYSCIIEDDGRVAYAYLMEGKEMIGNLWLYNQEATPAVDAWREDRGTLPYLNSARYVDAQLMLKPLETPGEAEVVWEYRPNGRLHMLHLILRGTHYGVLAPHVKPGWTVAASQDGPLAQHLAGN
ncbi:MAG TPA: hypothetical protein VK970_06520 [Candidatus Methylacidiphilales bacterium]|nr:hypothetical protein [Candidatus Methylacidiphilales bacterium]